jgi:light-regulated signal transduction histidine kinase (bacteriophytochrome)
MKDKDGKVIRIVCTIKDITELKEAQEQALILMRNLDEKNSELDEFTYIVSHDLKEPLRSLSAYSKFVVEDCKDKLGEEGNSYLERIIANSARMQKLIDDLLELSRIERKRNPYVDTNIENIIAEIRIRLEVAIKEKNAQILINGNLPVVFCDPVRLTEVFANLLSNAIKFTVDKPPRIEIGCNEKEAFYEFYVRDNGPGIEEQYFDKIFKIFQRLGKKEDSEGTGIGLTIVKKIIEMHKGRIWLTSKIGEGTTFYFTLPVDKKVILKSRRIGEILVDNKLVSEEDVQKALEEQERG